MRAPVFMHTAEIKQRIGVLMTIKASMEFTGRSLPDVDAEKLTAYREELATREAGETVNEFNARRARAA